MLGNGCERAKETSDDGFHIERRRDRWVRKELPYDP